MVFSSPVFLFYFLPVMLVVFYSMNRSIYLQNIALFLGSLLFYFWGEKEYSICVITSIVVNYSIGLWLDSTENAQRKKWVLCLGVCINLSLLIYFKYYNFVFNEVIAKLYNLPPLTDNERIHLPLGISFFTFHGITYIVDIYRRQADVSKSPVNVGLYTLFFPQLIAGPIVRYKNMVSQLEHRSLSNEKITRGVKRFIVGLAKKVLVANVIGAVADNIYKLEPVHLSNAVSWLGIACYSIQIYFDFSGYSDMAIGLANIFGFEFLENFNFPYSARSIREFWQRWHISLTNFFRDYVYIPLGGNQKGKFRTGVNLIVVFILTGLWHGASWNFLFWGLWHGTFILMERFGLNGLLQKATRLVSHLYTLLVVVFGWVFFRMSTSHEILFQFEKLLFLNSSDSGLYPVSYFLPASVAITLVISILFSFKTDLFSHALFKLKPLNTILYIILFLLSILALSNATYNPFIYFRF